MRFAEALCVRLVLTAGEYTIDCHWSPISGGKLVIRVGIARITELGCLAVFAQALPWLVCASVAFAQDSLDSADPAQIRRRIEESRPAPAKPAPEPTAIPQAPAPTEPSGAESGFVLSAVVIEGATVFEPGDLAPLYQDFLARNVTLSSVQEIAQRITQKYQDAGYVLTRAIVPPQQVQGGLLTVRVVEGYVARVNFEGLEGKEDVLAPYAAAIISARPTTLASLERNLLLINDLGGITVRSSALNRIDNEGAYEVIVTVDYDAYDGVAYVDNRGTPAVGRLQSWLSGAANNAFGYGERVQLGFFTVPDQPSELLYGELSYRQPIGADGTVLSTSVSGSRTDAGADLAAVESEGHSVRVTVRATHPVVLARGRRLTFSGSFDYLDVGEDRLGLTRLQDSLRVFRAGINYLRDDSWNGSMQFAAELSQGFDILGASDRGRPTLSRADGDGVFTKATAQISRTQGIGQNFGVVVAVKGQVSADPLLSSEEFSVGGSQFGRAYDFSEITGDDGVATSIEVRFGDSVNSDVLKGYQLYGFYDIGAVWNAVGASERRDTLASAGGGIRLTFARSIFGNVEVAKPLTRDVSTTDDRDVRVFFSLSAGF